MEKNIAEALRHASDDDILEQVEIRRLEEEVIDGYSRVGKRLYDADVNDLMVELASRGEHVYLLGDNDDILDKIYRKHLCGQTEEAGKEALEFIRNVLNRAL